MTEEEIRKVFAKNLKTFRQEAGLSQLALSGEAGITTNFLNDIENCKKWVSPATLAKLSYALGIQPYRFFLPIQANSAKQKTQIQDFCAEVTNTFILTLHEISKRYQ